MSLRVREARQPDIPSGRLLSAMNAEPLLSALLRAMSEARLEAILIGNAAAAIHGAPVATLDFDFMFRATPVNLAKLKKAAGRPRDRAVLDILERTLHEQQEANRKA